MKVGPGTDNGNDMGPLVTKPHFEKVKAYVDSGVAEGATLVVDGRGVKVQGHEEGYFLGACLFDHVEARHEDLPGRNLRPRAGRGAREDAARSHAAHQRPRIRQRHLHLHPRRRSRPLLHRPHPGRHGGRERAAARAGGLPLLRRLEAQLFGDLHAYGPDAVRFYTKRKTITQRWPSAGVREGAVFSFPSSR
jgi:NAD-dependent aldehyde dehydrogenases